MTVTPGGTIALRATAARNVPGRRVARSQGTAGPPQGSLTPTGGGLGAARPWGPSPLRPLVALAAGLAFGAAAQAQSLRDVYEAARGYDATYLAARAQADSAQYAFEQSKALRRPNVSLSGSATRTQTDSPRVHSNELQAGLRAEQPLFNRNNSIVIQQGERQFQIAQNDLQTAEQDLIVRVAQAYFDVLAAQDSLGTAQANKKAIGEQLASAKRNFEVGTATITDTREAQARFDLATAQEIAAENDLRTRQITLDQLVGRQGVAPKPLKVPVVLPPLVPARADEWVQFVDAAPAVRNAQLTYDVAQLETDRAKVAGWPIVALEGTVGGSRSTGNSPALQASSGGATTQASLGVTLQMPLYTGGSISNRVKETVSLLEAARNGLEATRRNVTLGTQQTFLGVQSGQAQVKALEAAESSSKIALEATQLGYRVGVRVNLDVLNAQTQLFTTQRDLARARYDVVVNSLRLRQAAGVLVPGDVDAANALLAN
jgi:outer membrane protein